MPLLYDRRWRVVVGAGIGALRVGLQIDKHRCYWHVEKTNKPEPNKCTLKIWNLSREQRAQIEELRPKEGSTSGIPVLIEAGYKATGVSQVFLGDLTTLYSEREGADWVTTIEGGDGEQAIQNSRINVAYGPRTSPDVALRAIVKALGVGEGNSLKALVKLRTTGAAKLLEERVVLSGAAAEHMTNFCNSAGLEWSIQDGAVQILDRDKALDGFAVVLSSSKGLVESPTVDPKGVLTARAFIQAGIRVGAKLHVESRTAQGNWRIERSAVECDTHGTPWYVTVEAKRY